MNNMPDYHTFPETLKFIRFQGQKGGMKGVRSASGRAAMTAFTALV